MFLKPFVMNNYQQVINELLEALEQEAQAGRLDPTLAHKVNETKKKAITTHSLSQEDVFRAVYVSVAHGAELISDETTHMFAKKNMALNITGVLALRNGWYFQVLEGDEREVRNLLGKIEKDPRHKNFTLRLAQSGKKRLFGEWGMASFPDDPKAFTQVMSSLEALPELRSSVRILDSAAPRPKTQPALRSKMQGMRR
jgi:hypothetical protein